MKGPQASIDRIWMERALEMARASLGTTAPNPAVGAILVRDGEIIGQGRTQPVGGAHAEVDGLRDCRDRGEDPNGATLYVTLEPCCHHGRTPPCSDAILAAGISRVVVGTLDPFEAMRGASLSLLRDAGVATTLGICRDACDQQVLGFARAITRGLPEVTVKAAMSADGRIATASGESQWITGEQARGVSQRLRAEHDAILVGIGTVLADDPRLTCRLEGATSPVPVVLDSHLRLPPGCQLDHPGTVVFTVDTTETGLQAEVVVVVAGDRGRVDVEAALRVLADRGLHRVLVEGGAEVTRSLLDAGLVDTVELFISGALIPGGQSWIGGTALENLGDATSLRLVCMGQVGEDAWLTWRAEHGTPPERP